MKMSATLLVSICLWGFLSGMAREADIKAKVPKEKPVWVIDLAATEKLVEFLEQNYITRYCHNDGSIAIEGTAELWNRAIWEEFALLIGNGASCKGALKLLASKTANLYDYMDTAKISKDSKCEFFDSIVCHYINADGQVKAIVERVIALQCSRYSCLADK